MASRRQFCKTIAGATVAMYAAGRGFTIASAQAPARRQITIGGRRVRVISFAEAAELAAQGLEVEVYGVPAYSTLGYMNWAGGDPLLSTFIAWPEGDFVRLLFHELAHQVVYAKNDTLFNESFATAVERIGVAQWLATQSPPAAREAYATSEARRSAFRALTRATRTRLAAIYEQKELQALEDHALNAMKTEAMKAFRDDYAALRARWLDAPGGTPPRATTAQVAGYDRWVAQANNASFAAQAAYDGRDYRMSASYLKRVLAQAPDYQPALGLAEELARVARPAGR